MTRFALFLVSLFIGNILATSEDDLRSGNRQFTAKLYQALLDTKPNENFVFCPFPIQSILATIASASENQNSRTVMEIRNAVNLPMTKEKTQEAFKAVIPQMNQADDDFKLFLASKLYLNYGYDVQQWYRDIALNVFHTEIENINFQSPTTVNNINAWVSQKTNGDITNFLDPNEIGTDTKQVIVNALSLLAKWDKPFQTTDTVKKNFYGPNGTYKVDMMVSHQSFEYKEDNYNKYLKMNLLRDGGRAHIIFLLSKKTDPSLLTRVNEQTTDQYSVAKVHVMLPKFTITSNWKLKPILQKLGIQEMFNWRLNLEGLSRSDYELVTVNEMFQKTLIEISEYGVRAAAGTTGEIFVDDPQNHKTFIADHPFVFQIVVDDMIVFAGRVANP